ncbi:hypothetical protein D3C79_496430 [compost metagenome]
MAIGQSLWQGGQTVARQHQLLQGGALAKLVRQSFDNVVGQDQPAQASRQGCGRDSGNPVGLEAHHGECRAAPQHLGQLGKAVLGAEEDAKLLEFGQLVRKPTQLVAGEIQYLQRLFEAQDFGGKHPQVFGEFEVASAAEFARAQLFQSMHNRFSILSWPCLAALKQTIWHRRTWARRF